MSLEKKEHQNLGLIDLQKRTESTQLIITYHKNLENKIKENN